LGSNRCSRPLARSLPVHLMRRWTYRPSGVGKTTATSTAACSNRLRRRLTTWALSCHRLRRRFSTWALSCHRTVGIRGHSDARSRRRSRSLILQTTFDSGDVAASYPDLLSGCRNSLTCWHRQRCGMSTRGVPLVDYHVSRLVLGLVFQPSDSGTARFPNLRMNQMKARLTAGSRAHRRGTAGGVRGGLCHRAVAEPSGDHDRSVGRRQNGAHQEDHRRDAPSAGPRHPIQRSRARG
jgi:hypothetical protein